MSQNLGIIRDQFTRQAEPFSEARSIKDKAALQLLVDQADPRPDDHMLDVACGPGLVVCAFAPAVARAVGLDATPAMLERAASLQRQRALTNVEWHPGDAAAIPFPAASFDIVTCRFAFHHFPDPLAVLKEMMRVCKSGGRILVADGYASDDPEKAAAFNRMERLRDPSTERFLSVPELRDLFRIAGLPQPAERYDCLPSELEALLKISFPDEGNAEIIREMFAASLAQDLLGLGARRENGSILFAYPTVIMVSPKP